MIMARVSKELRKLKKIIDEDFEFEVKINGISTEDELQDTFLEFVEENNN